MVLVLSQKLQSNLQKKLKFEETGVKYNPRTISEGKKIRTYDGIIALLCILKYSLKS